MRMGPWRIELLLGEHFAALHPSQLDGFELVSTMSYPGWRLLRRGVEVDVPWRVWRLDRMFASSALRELV